MSNPNRQPQGTPTGGQFAPDPSGAQAAPVSLGAHYDRGAELRQVSSRSVTWAVAGERMSEVIAQASMVERLRGLAAHAKRLDERAAFVELSYDDVDGTHVVGVHDGNHNLLPEVADRMQRDNSFEYRVHMEDINMSRDNAAIEDVYWDGDDIDYGRARINVDKALAAPEPPDTYNHMSAEAELTYRALVTASDRAHEGSKQDRFDALMRELKAAAERDGLNTEDQR